MNTRILPAACLAVGVMAAAPAVALDPALQPDPWRLEVGLGAAIHPAYEGADEQELSPMPMLRLAWKDRVMVDGPSVTAVVWQGRALRLGVSAAYEAGRKEEASRVLRGLGDQDDGLAMGVGADLMIGPLVAGASLRRDLVADGGSQAQVSLGLSQPLSAELTAGLQANAVFGDDTHMQTRFGVDAQQSARSGHRRHDAEAGLKSLGLTAVGAWRISPAWSLTGTAGYARLTDSVADSPLVKSRSQWTGFTGLSYSF